VGFFLFWVFVIGYHCPETLLPSFIRNTAGSFMMIYSRKLIFRENKKQVNS